MSEQAVLVATKLNEQSDQVVRAGLAVARGLGSTLHLLHSYKVPVLGDSQLSPSESAYDAVESGLRETLEEQALRVGVKAEEIGGLHLECGPVPRVLARAARELDAALVVVGGETEWGLGRRAERILRYLGRPVLVVRRELELPFERVLAPVDLSPLSADALRCGLATLAALSPERLPTVRAVFALNPLERVGSMHFSPQQIDRFAAEEMRRFVEHNRGLWSELETAIREGQPREVILTEADAWDADLILIGTHGRTGVERVVLGSVAEELVRKSPASLLVIPADAAARLAIAEEQRTHAHA